MSGVSGSPGVPSPRCPLGPGSPDSDYTSSPSASSGRSEDYSSRSSVSRRRATVPPCSSPSSSSSSSQKLPNLRVSLAKLSVPPELSQLSPSSSKKIKLETKEDDPSQNTANGLQDNKLILTDSKCNFKVLPKSLKILYNKVKHESPKDRDALLAKLKEEFNNSTEDTKLEISKLESILQGQLLLDIASHKLSDILLLDKSLNSFSVKEEVESFDEEKPTAKSLDISPLEATLSQNLSNNNNNLIEDKEVHNNSESTSQAKSVDDKFKEIIKCKWQGCEKDVEIQHLLEHLMVRFESTLKFNFDKNSVQNVHIATQKTEGPEGKFRCLWTGCKVFSTSSTSYTWLTRHVTKHVGSKPFLCIVDGCRQRFGSQVSGEKGHLILWKTSF